MAKVRYFIATIPHAEFSPIFLPEYCRYAKGQLEHGESGFLHWQVFLITKSPQRITYFKRTFPTAHFEPTRSGAAEEYVWKLDTRIDGTQFELGLRPVRRDRDRDWDAIRDSAISGRLSDIPSDVFVRCYNSLKRISSDYMRPLGLEREVVVFWGRTGTGKSRLAWSEAGLEAYPKDPRTKFWDGYRDQGHVVLDEFRGAIDISHVLRWFDRYPVIVEVKGSSTVFKATKIWITSNIHPNDWYPDLDSETKSALLRRFKEIKHFE